MNQSDSKSWWQLLSIKLTCNSVEHLFIEWTRKITRIFHFHGFKVTFFSKIPYLAVEFDKKFSSDRKFIEFSMFLGIAEVGRLIFRGDMGFLVLFSPHRPSFFHRIIGLCSRISEKNKVPRLFYQNICQLELSLER